MEDYNGKSKVKLMELKPRNRMLLSQKKSLVDLPFDPEPYTVVKVEGTRVTIKRGDSVKTHI